MYTMERQLNAESVEPKQRIRDSKLGRRGDVKTLKYFSLVVLQKKKRPFLLLSSDAGTIKCVKRLRSTVRRRGRLGSASRSRCETLCRCC